LKELFSNLFTLLEISKIADRYRENDKRAYRDVRVGDSTAWQEANQTIGYQNISSISK